MLLDEMAGSPAASKSAAQLSQGSAARAQQAKEQFLTLLVAQISHQNPMEPMDDREMVSQLAQFSAIEQAIETNSRLESMERSQKDGVQMALAQLVGRDGVASTAGINIGNVPGPQPISFSLPTRSEQTTVRILDAENNVVRSLDVGALPHGPQQIMWDGKNNKGAAAKEGRYKVSIDAIDEWHRGIAVDQELKGTISELDLQSDEPMLKIGGAKIRAADISRLL